MTPAQERLLEAAKLMVNMGAIWNVDPDKSPNTMNVGFDQLKDAIAAVEAEAAQPNPIKLADELAEIVLKKIIFVNDRGMGHWNYEVPREVDGGPSHDELAEAVGKALAYQQLRSKSHSTTEKGGGAE